MISGALIRQAGCILFHSKRDIKHKSFAFIWRASTIHVIPGESLVEPGATPLEDAPDDFLSEIKGRVS